MRTIGSSGGTTTRLNVTRCSNPSKTQAETVQSDRSPLHKEPARQWALLATVLVLIFGAKLTHETAAGEIVICNYEKFHLFDSMYRPRTDNFCVFNDVYLGADPKGADFLASSLDYKRVAFANSKFAQVPPSLFKNFDDIRELYVRRCSLEALKVTRQLERVYAGGNRIASVQLDGNASNSLRELYLDGNRLQGLANLTNLPALEVLVLENNPLLGNVDLVQFARMEHLWKLDLERIGMGRLRNGLTRPLAELRRLDLSNNALTYVHVRMFRTFPALEHLWLHGNRLYFMETDQVREFMPTVRAIVIDDNYWGCGHLGALGKHLRREGIVIRHGDCRTGRAEFRVCCSEETDLVDTRYLIEMDIRREVRFERDVHELRAENDFLRQDVERLRGQLQELMVNLTAGDRVGPQEPTSREQDSSERPSASFEEYTDGT
ncbi:vasorin-like [Anopheles nili]|uniref:vasorin-like n=1 Tax=Anopheles nili TaxID=185578 RepID=UPI00237C4F0C|nr:vasorin-like [Anopheles nili]